MTRVGTFPREYSRQFFRDIDKDFMLITLLTFLVSISMTVFLSTRPIQELSAEDIRRYTEVIYRANISPPKVVEKKVEEAVGAGEAEEEVVEEEVVEEKPVTEVAKKEVREDKRAERRSRQESRREKVRETAKRMKILAGPTARGRSRAGGANAAREALGLSSGQMGGYDVKKMVGMVGDAGKAEKVKKLRGGDAISEDIGDIDIEELRALSSEDLELMLKEASVELNEKAITAKGRGSKSKQRSPSAISEIVMKNKNQVQYCYWTLKRRDSSLKGRVVVEFTIDAAGEVIRVRFRQHNWGGNKLGGDVERCIQNVIKGWRFDPIDPKAGNVTAGATYIFE